jgi:hypothetical protein
MVELEAVAVVKTSKPGWAGFARAMRRIEL